MNSFETRFNIGKLPFGLRGAAPILIAETACAHDGSADEAMRLVDASVEAGADMVQLQVFRAAEQVPPGHKLRELLERIALSDADWTRVFRHAARCGKEIMAFVYDLPSLAVALENGIVALKLNSADLLNRPLLAGCAKSGLPIFLGTGASTIEEIAKSLACIAENGGTKVILMHGVQDFPTAVSDARIDRIRLLRETFGLPVGFGDHTDATLPVSRVIDLMALGLGAQVLEKHITMNRREGKPDHQAALEPDEWKTYAEIVRTAATGLSASAPVELTAADRRYRRFQKKFAVASRAISEGEVVTTDAVHFLRLEEDGEISAIDFAGLGEVVANRSLAPYEMLRNADLRSTAAE